MSDEDQNQQLGGNRTDEEVDAVVRKLGSNDKSLRELVGEVMRHYQGKVNPAQVVRIVKSLRG